MPFVCGRWRSWFHVIFQPIFKRQRKVVIIGIGCSEVLNVKVQNFSQSNISQWRKVLDSPQCLQQRQKAEVKLYLALLCYFRVYCTHWLSIAHLPSTTQAKNYLRKQSPQKTDETELASSWFFCNNLKICYKLEENYLYLPSGHRPTHHSIKSSNQPHMDLIADFIPENCTTLSHIYHFTWIGNVIYSQTV